MGKNVNQRNVQPRVASIDLFKFVCAVFVVAIHTSAVSGFPNIIRFFLAEIVFRLAVPFFCMATGYFLAERLIFKEGYLCLNRENKRCLAALWKKNARIYICWSFVYLLVYIPLWKKIGWLSPWAFVDWGIAAIRQGSYYHMWYMLSLLYALPIFAILASRVNRKNLPFLAVAFYLIKAVSYAYRIYMPAPVQRLLSVIDMFGSVGTALVTIVPYMILGMCAHDRQHQRQKYLLFFGLSMLLLTCEALAIKHLGGTAYSYIFFSMPAAYFFFQMVLRVNYWVEKRDYRHLAKLSVFVYCAHPAINAGAEVLIKNPGVLRFVVVLSVTLVWGHLVSHRKMRIFEK